MPLKESDNALFKAVTVFPSRLPALVNSTILPWPVYDLPSLNVRSLYWLNKLDPVGW